MSENKPSKHRAHYDLQYLRDLKVPDYKKHAEIIKPFVDGLAEYSDALIDENEALYVENEQLEHKLMIAREENATLTERNKRIVGENNKNKFIIFVGGVLFTVGAGITLATSNYSIITLGWLLMVSGIAISLAPMIYFRFIAKRINGNDLEVAESVGDDE